MGKLSWRLGWSGKRSMQQHYCHRYVLAVESLLDSGAFDPALAGSAAQQWLVIKNRALGAADGGQDLSLTSDRRMQQVFID